VMYVLHHADKPSIYANLPDRPRISPLVDLWKGVVKPLSLVGIGFAVIAGFLHWILEGPNEVEPQDEAQAAEILKSAGKSP
jgi:formate dehydrogenase iron-sulfur subunit